MANFQIIKELLKEKKMSMRELADRLGCAEPSLHRIVAKNSASLQMIEMLADTFGVSPAVFFSTKYSYTEEMARYRESALIKEIESLRKIIAEQERTIDLLRDRHKDKPQEQA